MDDDEGILDEVERDARRQATSMAVEAAVSVAIDAAAMFAALRTAGFRRREAFALTRAWWTAAVHHNIGGGPRG